MLRYILAVCALGMVGAQMTCNEKFQNTCQNQFADSLGIDRGLNWDNPRGLMLAVQNIYINGDQASGLSGLIKVCNAFNAFVKCMNDAGLDPDTCLGAMWLLHHDKDPSNAYQYAMLMRQIRWQCSAGFYPAFDNWECIQRVYANRNGTLIQCIDSFRANANEATASEKCSFAATARKCYQTPFYETCPGVASVRNYGCESMRQYITAEYPQCLDYCVAAALVATPVRSQAQNVTTCDSPQFNACTRMFAAHIGYPMDASNVWLDAVYFNDMLEQKYLGGDINNVAYICNGLQMLYACLGRYLTTCLTVRGLTQVKQMEPHMAYAYLGYMSMWRFMCGAGFYAVEKSGSLPCIQNTMRNRFNDLNTAADTYRLNIEHEPAKVCDHAKTLQSTFASIYRAGQCLADNHADLAGFWACEGQKEYTEAQFRECSHVNKCDYLQKPTTATLPEHVKFENGNLMFKLAPTWKQTENGEWILEPAKWI